MRKLKGLTVTQWLVVILVLIPMAISICIKERILDTLLKEPEESGIK